ncbi:hypothetical protein EMIT048CA2_10113 [Pseudomonas chlororaphis]
MAVGLIPASHDRQESAVDSTGRRNRLAKSLSGCSQPKAEAPDRHPRVLDSRFCPYSKELLREYGKSFPDGRLSLVDCRPAAW